MLALPTNWRGIVVLPGARPIMPRAPGRDRRLAGPVRMGLAGEGKGRQALNYRNRGIRKWKKLVNVYTAESTGLAGGRKRKKSIK